MKNIYALIFAAGLLMNSVDSVCSQEQDVYKVVGRRVVELAVFTGVAYFSYNFGRWAQNDSHDVCEKIKYEPMDLVVARFNLNKTDLDAKNELSMPPLEFVSLEKQILEDECARAIADVNAWSQQCQYKKTDIASQKPVRSIPLVRGSDRFNFKKS
jgi:hypothetical protein